MASFVTAGWVASSHGTEQYLQVDFEAIYDVTALEFTRATLSYGTRKLRYINPDISRVLPMYTCGIVLH